MKVRFEETPVGYLLKHEAKTEWELVEVLRKNLKKINTQIIERITTSSRNPLFRSKRYADAIEDFRRYGLRTPNKRTFDTEDELRIIKSRINLKGESDTQV